MSIQLLILKNGIITPPRSAADIAAISVPTAAPGTNTTQIANTAFVTNAVAGVSTANFVSIGTAQTITGDKIFSGALQLPTVAGTTAGTIWRNGNNLEYKDGSNVTKILLNSAGNLSNLMDKQAALNNLVGTQVANRVLKSNGTNVTLSQVALDTDVINILPIANGGTGSNTQNFVDLTTAQTVAGNKTLSGIITLSNTTAATSTTSAAAVFLGGVGIAGDIKVRNAWLLIPRSNTTAVNANTVTFPNYAGTQWIDGGATNTNFPLNSGMLQQFDSLFGTTDANKYRVQEFLGFNGNCWRRIELNSVWGAWKQIAYV